MPAFLSALNREFRQISGSPEARRAVRRWATRHPELAGLHTLEDILRRRSRQPKSAPAILLVLATLAPDDELAARTLLHALLPGLNRLARTAGYDDPQAIEDMVSLAWERIRTYPASRRGGVAANVLLDVRKRYRKDRGLTAPSLSDVAADQPAATVRSAEDEALDLIALAELAAARRRGVVSEANFRLIVQTRFAGFSLAELAVRQNVRPHHLAQRRYHAECRLLNALRPAG